MTEQSSNLPRAFKTSNRKHILMITNHGIHQWQVVPGLPDTGGQNVFVNQFTEALARYGFKITIINRGGYAHPVTGEWHSGVRYKDEHQRIVYIEDGQNEFIRKEDMAAQLPALADFLKNFLEKDETDVDLIISHYWDAAKLGLLYNESRAKPLKHVWVPHSLGAIKKRNMEPAQWPELRIDERIEMERSMIKDLDGIASTSSAIRLSLQDDYGYTGPYLFLPPCVDPGRYHPRHQGADEEIWRFLSEHSGLTPEEIRNCKIVTEISRTDRTKRKNVLIEAFAQAHKQAPNSFLVVSIDDNREALAQELRGLIKKNGIGDHTAVVGSIWDILPMIYAVTDVYCTPSVMEGFGMSAQEAAATKVPVVASHLVPFVVEHLLGEEVQEVEYEDEKPPLRQGGGAVVVPADDVDGFAHALTTLLTDDKARLEMGENAFRITIPHFTWGHIVDDFIQKIGVIEQQLSRSILATILQKDDVEQLALPDLIDLFRTEEGLANFAPDGICQIDPRNGERIAYNSARARRPHDNRPVDADTTLEEKACVVCQGKTTGVVDVADLSEGFTFINKNLFPILYPQTDGAAPVDDDSAIPGPEGLSASGLHILQWTSSIHSKDWHNMPLDDRIVVMERLAVLEKKLQESTSGQPGYVEIIKNYGRLVGGSLIHGHQQIGLSNVMPSRMRDNHRFEQERGETFTAYMLRENPGELLIKDYGPAVLLTPYFMRRPFDMMLILKDTAKRYVHQLTAEEIKAVAEGWHDAIRTMLWVMPKIGRETAYNIVTNNGPGAGLYFEFLPYTQEMGGFERLGLFICQGNPQDSAAQIKEFLED